MAGCPKQQPSPRPAVTTPAPRPRSQQDTPGRAVGIEHLTAPSQPVHKTAPHILSSPNDQVLLSALAGCDLSAAHPPHEKHPHLTDEETEADTLPKILQKCSAHAPLLRCPVSSAALNGPGKWAKE